MVIPVKEIIVFQKRISDIVYEALQNIPLFLEWSREQENRRLLDAAWFPLGVDVHFLKR
jgi:hypothetical protein